MEADSLIFLGLAQQHLNSLYDDDKKKKDKKREQDEEAKKKRDEPSKTHAVAGKYHRPTGPDPRATIQPRMIME